MPDKELITVWEKGCPAACFFKKFDCREYTPSVKESLQECFTRALSDACRSDKKSAVFIVCSDEVFSRRIKDSKAERIVSLSKGERSWDFIFIGPDVNASIIAGSFGIEKLTAVRYGRDTTALKAACGLAIRYV